MLTKKRVVFYLVDGARPDVLSELLSKGELPNFSRIAEEGTYRMATSCFPSTTGPAYLPFLTGHFPGTMGITGIRWFDKYEFKRSRLNKYAMRSYCGPEAAWFNTDMPVDKPTLFELTGRAYNLYNMITRNVPDEFDLGKKGKGLLYTRAHFLKRHHPVDFQGHARIMDMFRQGNDFDFLFAVFPSVDWDSHYYHYRDQRTVEAYKIADQSLGEVREFLEKKGWWNDTLFVLTSDHGLTATHSHLDLGDWMAAHDLKSVYYPVIWKNEPKSAVMISGNSFGSIHLLNHEGAHVLREKELRECFGEDRLKALLSEEAFNFISYRGQTENSFYVENKDGKAFIEHKGAGYSYRPVTADPFGFDHDLHAENHREALDITFDSAYPDALVQIAQLFQSRRAGDLVTGAKPGYDLRDFWEYPEHKGSHGSLDREHMMVPLLYNQQGWATHAARTADLFNTILKWKGKAVRETEGNSLF
ncbi:alkaline phosphatase family protein [Pararcticibacter amylolyticus]|uniref:alkaline phosphatase family protein n=1 Tax=Pararcticibacter amylolyticus TaxID=2173175 RepID=UPI001304C00A|nr:alkaline phosphatase family protein [Pararcticibacter amylolyticus]